MRILQTLVLWCALALVTRSAEPTTAQAADPGKRVFLIGNSLTWDTLPPRLDGDVQWHVDCGKSLPFIHANPEKPCVKSSTLWPKALSENTYDLISVQPHYGSTIETDVKVISKWIALQPKAEVILHTGWAHAEHRAAEYAEGAPGKTLRHSPAHIDALLAALREANPGRVFRSSRAQDLLAMISADIETGQGPLKNITDLYRDAIHMTNNGGRYLMHNAMRKALGQPASDKGFKTTPELKTYLDQVLSRLGSVKAAAEKSPPDEGIERPNVVFFIADDISWNDIGCAGNPVVKTPSIDALAANGMRFNQAYLTTSSCSPSRCSIISGRYPHNTGAPELHTTLPEGQTRFPERLREAGYYTVLSGKNHMFGRKDRAFDKITGGGGPGKEADWVQHVEDRPKDKPFFFWFASSDAHRDWKFNDEAPRYDPEDVIVPPYLFDGPKTRQDIADYYHEVSRFDTHIGRVTEALREQGLLDNTLIVIAADNGRPLPRAKSRLYDSGIKTPWIVHFPALVQKPAVTERLVSVIDLSATCLDLAGIERPPEIQGRSFAPILRDPTATVREVVFAEHNWHVYANHGRMVRFGDYLFIRNNRPNQMNLCYEAHEFPAGEELWEKHAAGETTPAQHQLFANPCPEEELFVVSADPFQLTNLAGDDAHAEALKTARDLLARWTAETGDTIPERYTPHRHAPPRIEDGKVIPPDKKAKPRNPKGEMPGASTGAAEIVHPGPIRLK